MNETQKAAKVLNSEKEGEIICHCIIQEHDEIHFFLDKPFTGKTVAIAHERAFEFFGGIPQSIAYDQDATMVVDENLGEIVLTSIFI